MSLISAHTYNHLLHQIQSPTQNMKNNQVNIVYYIFSFSPPILCRTLFVLNTCLVYQILLNCFVGTVYFVSVTVAVVKGFVTVVTVCLEHMGYSLDFYHHSSLLLHFVYFCKWGQLGPHPHFFTFGVMLYGGLLLLGIVALSLLGGRK